MGMDDLQKMVVKHWRALWKKINLGPYLTPYMKINLKRLIDLNLRVNTIKLQEDNIRENARVLEFRKHFLNSTKKYELYIKNCISRI